MAQTLAHWSKNADEWILFCNESTRAAHTVHCHTVHLPLGALLTWCAPCVAQEITALVNLAATSPEESASDGSVLIVLTALA